MTRRSITVWAATGAVVLALLGTPAAAQETEDPPIPEGWVPVQPGGQPPGAQPEVNPPVPVPAQPPVAQQCAPCEQRPSPPAAHQGLLLMGYVGVNAFPGKGALDSSALGLSMSVDAGLRLGALVGYNVTPWISVNGELTVDVINSDDPSGYWKTGGTRKAIALSPFFHLAASSSGLVEAAIGPKLGFRWMNIGSQGPEEFSSNGYLAGLNAGVFVRGGVVMLGGLVSFEYSPTSEVCRQQDFINTDCSYSVDGISAEKVVSLSGSLLF